jgi:hypothetical protein
VSDQMMPRCYSTRQRRKNNTVLSLQRTARPAGCVVVRSWLGPRVADITSSGPYG